MEIHKDGTIVKNGKPCKVYDNGNGYKFIVLNRKNYYVHRIVATFFIPNSENKPCINHKDFDRGNNCVDNLEWCTYKENTHHAMRHGRYKIFSSCFKGEGNNFSKLCNEDIIIIRSLYGTGYYTQQKLAEIFETTQQNIYKIVNKIRWKHV